LTTLVPALHLEFPPSLPVSERRGDIAAALQAHQVLIVCGETGSGKTTQLPKIALSLGRGRIHGGGLIGHTQPRRIAASSVAKRIAQELQTPLGEVVGYKVRFQDRVSPGASVKLMTDGILLAETQTDPLLRAYDTIIIDEAHERSLNIDFLLGYLRQLLPRRPDLKLIVTSATIDAQRFADHFAGPQGPAPVITVSGRLFPVEQRYRPFEESREYDLNNAIADAVDELWAGARGGDILVFLPGEREIREASEHVRKHLSHQPLHRQAEILPLFARLSQAEQDRVFDASSGRRIVLATNVAETSLTVPGIRYVIDAGTARVKRYSYRSKVEQLLVEPVSRAAANQRAGRCGRVADGICIRLYGEADFNSRPAFSDPEILRSSLAGVILRMKALHLGDVEQFPFIDPPPRRAVADGYQLLTELGAVDTANQLTPLGRELSRLPLDPRVGRMLLEARDRQALDEVLVIASALSVQDVRDRPLHAQAAADQAHAPFDDEKSEFSGYLTLWRWLDPARGRSGGGGGTGAGTAQPDAAVHKLSHRQYEQKLREQFINVRRVREWRDIHSQLLTVVAEHGWRLNTTPASYEQLHLALLAGLLGHVGCKVEDENLYLGARGLKFLPHPGARLRKKPGRWLVAAELVETTRLFGRGLAAIDPVWIEQVGAHVLNRQLLDPHWEKKAAQVTALERATLYGIVVYNNRRVAYGRVDPVAAREIFIREALVHGQWDTKLPFLAANQKLIDQVQELEHKSRRQDVLVDDELIYAFYDAQVPPDVCSGASLEAWYRQASRQQPRLLLLSREELMRHEAAGITSDAFPRTIRVGGIDCRASYLHEPGDARDGVTVELPLFALNQADEARCDWLVPGMLKDKVLALLKSLPQRVRGRLVPLPDTAERLCAELPFAQGGLIDALLLSLRERTRGELQRTDFKPDMLSPHLFMHFRVLDEHGRQLGSGRSLAALKAEWGTQARGAFQALAALRSTVPAAMASPPVPPRKQKADRPAATSSAQTPGQLVADAQARKAAPDPPGTPARPLEAMGMQAGAAAPRSVAGAPAAAPLSSAARFTSWTFGDWPECMELQQGPHTLIGFPALLDAGDAVTIAVFDEPTQAASRHRAGLRRLVALQLKDVLKALEKSLPGLQHMAVAYMPLGSAEELREQIMQVALERAFLQEPLPVDEAGFATRLVQGRARLGLIAQEVARLAGSVLADYAAALRKIKDTRGHAEAVADAQQQVQRLMPRRFLCDIPYARLQQLSRYLKGVTLRLDKLRSDPARDAQRLSELRPVEARYWRLLSERKGVADAQMADYRWLIEELRVSLFAQELRTPQPVSLKRLDKAWTQLIA